MLNYHRRKTTGITVGNIKVGGDSPIRIQTMANTDTNDIPASVEQARRCIDAGAELLRYTTQGTKEALNLKIIRDRLQEENIYTPIVADIHFNPKVAETAACYVDKIRINPGNFVSGKQGEYTEEEWNEELDRIREKLRPLLKICKDNDTAVRIGVNHGSLSPRIMSRYGNTPLGLAVSCMEFIELCEQENFTNLILSVKASNTRVMIHAVRMLVDMMDRAGKHYPLHLGVTEAGSDDEGRIKSAVGIGTLLGEGIGDTIRVSLSENPEAELPVARKLVDYISRYSEDCISGSVEDEIGMTEYFRRKTHAVGNIGGDNPPVVVLDCTVDSALQPDYIYSALPYHEYICKADALSDSDMARLAANPDIVLLLSCSCRNKAGALRNAIRKFDRYGLVNPIIAAIDYEQVDIETLQIQASADFGPLLIDGLLDGVYITCSSPSVLPERLCSLAFGILQASRARFSQTEYISCPGCGRTKYDLPNVVRRIKQATAQYVGLKIAVMGCIVNGPGEMSDADFGYIGAGQGKVSLYKGKECIKKNIPEENAIDELVKIIESYR